MNQKLRRKIDHHYQQELCLARVQAETTKQTCEGNIDVECVARFCLKGQSPEQTFTRIAKIKRVLREAVLDGKTNSDVISLLTAVRRG